MQRVVLITGCSTGIGRDLTQRLAQGDYAVIATARKLEALDDMPAALKLPLDVTKQASVSGAIAHVLEKFGRIDVMVNNAGYAVRGALEEVSDEQVRQLFDVNVFGALRMIRAVAPIMRRQKTGCIINVSSIAGKVSMPVNGAYSASKFALEALNDALRLELAPFGVRVISIEPGPIRTHFDETARSHTQQLLSNPASPYRALYQNSAAFEASMRRNEQGAELVSDVIQHAIESNNSKTRYLAGVALPAKVAVFLRDFIWDAVLKRTFTFSP